MSKPLTMTVEREAWIREHGAGVTPQSWQPGVTMLRDLLAEVDALRAALAAAEAARDEATSLLADTRASIHWAEVEALKANLADERKHAEDADAILTRLRRADYEFTVKGNRDAVNDWLAAHAARRNAEKEERC